MSARTRKLVGTIALLGFLATYTGVVMAIGLGRITGAHGLVQFVFFLIAGLLWVVPAGLLIRWMQRSD